MKEKKLQISRYGVRGPVDLTIAVVADLHGRAPDLCLAALNAEKPDVICVAGDAMETAQPADAPGDDGGKGWDGRLHKLFHFVDSLAYRRENAKVGPTWLNAMRFFREAAKIAPVFYATGNHDFWITREDRRLIADAGVRLLCNSSAMFHFGDVRVEIGGLASRSGVGWLQAFARRPGYRVLICHRPEYYERYTRSFDIPLVLSGHAHGGQWRVLNRGIFAPGQGLFPRYTRGLYDGRLVVSAGLSNTANLPRINNPVELVVVRVRREDVGGHAGALPRTPAALRSNFNSI
jgi:predicted MPP superfamily phosphohydrolase